MKPSTGKPSAWRTKALLTLCATTVERLGLPLKRLEELFVVSSMDKSHFSLPRAALSMLLPQFTTSASLARLTLTRWVLRCAVTDRQKFEVKEVR